MTPDTTAKSLTAPEEGAVSLRFTGQAGEYFRIWMVNVCLSIMTLGIYSAWAKVRRKQYFYGNTLLNDAAFEYLADPKAILKGRLIVFGSFVIYEALDQLIELVPGVENAATDWLLVLLPELLLLVAALYFLPKLVVRALGFNARNSAYRNVRFRFGASFVVAPGASSSSSIGGRREARRLIVLAMFLVPLSAGLAYPYYVCRKRKFVLENADYGNTPFSFHARPGAFYFAYFKAAQMFVVFLIGSVATLGIGALPLYILFAAYRDTAVARLTWRNTSLGPLRFDCNWSTWDLFKLHFVNAVGVIFTLGLLAPWAAIRAARYQTEGISVRPAAELGNFVATSQEQVSATGDEAVEFLGIDFGL